MSSIRLQYGPGYTDIHLPENIQPDIIAPHEIDPALDPIKEVENAILHPLGGHFLDQSSRFKTAAIAINDKTRPVPHAILLPPLLKHLEEIGFAPQDISLIIATGTHIPMQPEEFSKVLPQEIIDRYPVYSHDTDAQDLIALGATQRGTPILVNRRFMEADLKIVVGNIEPHHFMGFSGGVKTASIGLGGRQTINQNHALLTHPNSKTGHYEDNLMRMEVEEIGKRIGVYFALNAILNNHKGIVRVIAGEPVAVMKEGIALARSICQVTVSHPYDLVIASSGGYPKDINLYQSQKALTHASMLARDGGIVILLAACVEGPGSKGYEESMKGVSSFEEVFARFRSTGFEVGPHKAYLVARDASRVNIYLKSEMEPAKVESLLLHPVIDLDQLVLESISKLQPSPRVAVMPIATITIPLIKP